VKCIWCKREGIPKSLEHIIPESLGCPEGFVFSNGEVCQKCNNNLGNVDQALLHEFEPMAFQAGIRRKKGKPPKVDSFPGFRAEVVDGEPTYYLNMEKYEVVTDSGVMVPPRKSNERGLNGSIQKIGDMAKLTFSFKLGKHKKFNRALHKVAFASAAFFVGAQQVIGPEYDHIREYVCHGGEPRPVIILRHDKYEFRNEVFSPYVSDLTGFYLVTFILCGLEIIVDLSTDLKGLNDVTNKLQKNHEYDGWWSIMPPMKNETAEETA